VQGDVGDASVRGRWHKGTVDNE